MELKKRNPIVSWIIKSKVLGILFFVLIGALAVFKLGQSLIDNPPCFFNR
jgi:hypothetical protein